MSTFVKICFFSALLDIKWISINFVCRLPALPPRAIESAVEVGRDRDGETTESQDQTDRSTLCG